MVKLGVNIDHVATLRQARGTVYPSVTDAAKVCMAAGVYGITVHLREDRRHIQDADVWALREILSIPLNLEMGNAPEIVGIALQVVPEEVCLVPERREELTTEGGLDVAGQREALAETVAAMADKGIAVSMFIDPDEEQVQASADIGAPCIELHTGTFCDAGPVEAEKELTRLIAAARQANGLGLQVNAGHGINLENVDRILEIPHLDTLNIGHSIVARAVMVGLENAVKEMMAKLGA